MPEAAPTLRNRNIALTAAAALAVGSVIFIEGPNLVALPKPVTGCTYKGDSPVDQEHMDRLMTITLTNANAEGRTPKPTDFGLHSLSASIAPLSDYLAFEKRAIHFGGDVRPVVTITASYSQVKHYVASIATAYGIQIDDTRLAAEPAQLEKTALKESMLSFSDFLLDLPLETVERTGLTTLQLEAVIAGNATILGDIQTAEPNIMHLAVPELNGSLGAETYDRAGAKYTFSHELYHILDTFMCRVSRPKPIAIDHSFSGMNHGHSYGERGTPTPYYFDAGSDFLRQVGEAFRGNVATSCATLVDKTSDIIFGSDYGATRNAAEDKAETGVYTFFPHKYKEIMAMKKSAFRQKFVKLMSRLHAFDPQSAQYLIHEAAMRQATDQYLLPCISD